MRVGLDYKPPTFPSKGLMLELHNLFRSDLVQRSPVPLGCIIWCCVFGRGARLDSNPGRTQPSLCPEPPSVSLLGSQPLQLSLGKSKWSRSVFLDEDLSLPAQILMKTSSGCSVVRNSIQTLWVDTWLDYSLSPWDSIWKSSYQNLIYWALIKTPNIVWCLIMKQPVPQPMGSVSPCFRCLLESHVFHVEPKIWANFELNHRFELVQHFHSTTLIFFSLRAPRYRPGDLNRSERVPS